MSAFRLADLYSATPEQRLILMLLSQPADGEAAALRESLEQSDWQQVLGIATPSIRPFLHFVLSENRMLDRIPGQAQALLERAKIDAVLRYMRRKTQLQRIFCLFAEHGIEAVVLKGASLAESVYPAPYLRPMQDVDLWIAESQMLRAQSLLEAEGFCEKHVPSLESDVRTGKEIRLAKFFNYDLVVIELHATLDVHLPDEQLETDAIWKRRIGDPGSCVKALHPRDMLYHLCTHLALRHRFEQGLLWLLDIRLFLEKHGARLEWHQLAEDSRRQQTSKHMYVCLEMVRDLLGAAVPAAALAEFVPPNDVHSVKLLAWRQLWHSNFAVLPPRRFLMLATADDRFAFMLDRLKKYPGGKSLDGGTPTGRLQGAWAALQWVVSDLRKGYAAFRKGAFSRVNLQKACEMEIRRTEFEKAMQG